MSETLKLITKHWTAPDVTEATLIDLPFNVEEFCIENDRIISALRHAKEALLACANSIERRSPAGKELVAALESIKVALPEAKG